MFHVHLETTGEAVLEGVRRLATDEGTWTWPGSMSTGVPGIRRVELTVGEATLGFSPADVARIVRSLLPDARTTARRRSRSDLNRKAPALAGAFQMLQERRSGVEDVRPERDELHVV